ncbi:PTS sugar transporter subunit IIA [Thermophilibacter provencensis]|uniref:Ascorbate-specific PTS system EIIA component n=1 Tax=Thermophilibacter provencensis TaxID=1852386 RepID=A0ABT7V289_9ACTN|nr:PTS sugar transporter subunit IIA [Thermophilibacter provencensis]MDM8270723.1 PTS sugar transporter subunit IIA [Thermophilibacter provencensis]
MLSDLLDEGFVQLGVEADDWEDAVRTSTRPLLDAGKIAPSYVEDIISGVKDLGPYIVIAPHVALPHARPECGALEPAVGVVTLREPVEFGSANDPVRYLFPLSATDDDGHLGALQSLVEILSDADFFAQLDRAKTPAKVVELVKAKEGRL